MWWGVAVSLALAIRTVAPSAPPGRCPDLFKLELGLYAARVPLVARRHLCAVLLHHVRLEVERGAEDDELLREALGAPAGVVRVCEVLFLPEGDGGMRLGMVGHLHREGTYEGFVIPEADGLADVSNVVWH